MLWLRSSVLCVLVAGNAHAGPVQSYFLKQQNASPYVDLFEILSIPAGVREINLYIMVGDLNETFDKEEFRPDAVVLPTNTTLDLGPRAFPTTQRELLLKRLDEAERAAIVDQIETARERLPLVEGTITLPLGEGTIPLTLPVQPGQDYTLPRTLCLVATDYAPGGANKNRDFRFQKPLSKGLASCFEEVDRREASSIETPLVGSALYAQKPGVPLKEGARWLKTCRLLNALGGIVIGLVKQASQLTSIEEVGIIFFDDELDDLFAPQPDETEANGVERLDHFVSQVKGHLATALTGEAPVPSCS